MPYQVFPSLVPSQRLGCLFETKPLYTTGSMPSNDSTLSRGSFVRMVYLLRNNRNKTDEHPNHEEAGR